MTKWCYNYDSGEYEYIVDKGDKKLRGYYDIAKERWVGQDYSITVKFYNKLTVPEGGASLVFFFASMPVSGVTLTISGVTSDKKVYTKTAAKAVDIEQGLMTYMNVNMSQSTSPTDYSGNYIITDYSRDSPGISRLAIGRTVWLNSMSNLD